MFAIQKKAIKKYKINFKTHFFYKTIAQDTEFIKKLKSQIETFL